MPAPARALLDEVDHRQPVDDDEVVPASFANALNNGHRKPHPVLIAAAPLIFPAKRAHRRRKRTGYVNNAFLVLGAAGPLPQRCRMGPAAVLGKAQLLHNGAKTQWVSRKRGISTCTSPAVELHKTYIYIYI